MRRLVSRAPRPDYLLSQMYNSSSNRHYRPPAIRARLRVRTPAHCVRQGAREPLRCDTRRLVGLASEGSQEKPGAPQGKISNLLLSVKGKVSRAKRPAE